VRATTAILQVKRACERGSQVISTRYPFRVDTGFLVWKRWEWTGFSPGSGVSWRDQRAPAASLIFSPCLNDLPENTPSLSGFAGFSRHV